MCLHWCVGIKLILALVLYWYWCVGISGVCNAKCCIGVCVGIGVLTSLGVLAWCLYWYWYVVASLSVGVCIVVC